MATAINRGEVQRLLERGASLVEVLEPSQFRAAHLPGAVSIPAWEMSRERAAATIDRDRPVIVYCFDTLWDLSPRAACLLDLYGYPEVYDYVDGKVDWMGAGLAVESERGPYVGDALVEVPTVGVELAASEAANRVAHRAVAVTPGGVAVGVVDAETLVRAEPGTTVLDVMGLVPNTIRPGVPLSAVDEHVDGRLVTTSDGVLLGALSLPKD